MHLVRNSENKRPPGAVAQQPVPSRPSEPENQSVKDYEAIILAQPSKATGTEDSHNHVAHGSPRRVSKISVDDVQKASFVDRGLSKTETQVGAVGDGENHSQSQSQQDADTYPDRLSKRRAESQEGEPTSPNSIQMAAAMSQNLQSKLMENEGQRNETQGSPTGRADGGIAVGRHATVNTVLLSSTPPPKDQIEDPGTVGLQEKRAELTDEDLDDKIEGGSRPVIACQITSTSEDKDSRP